MGLENFLDRAERYRFQLDSDVVQMEKGKLGEGANKSAYVSPRGYVVKPVVYDVSNNPFDNLETVEGIDIFPDVEIEEVENQSSPFQHAFIRQERADFSHSEAVDALSIFEVIDRDLSMFEALRS